MYWAAKNSTLHRILINYKGKNSYLSSGET